MVVGNELSSPKQPFFALYFAKNRFCLLLKTIFLAPGKKRFISALESLLDSLFKVKIFHLLLLSDS